jgi:1,4-alpha-glucan branching enzyme
MPPYSPDDQQPASVVKFAGGLLVPSDPMGEEPDISSDPPPDRLPPNNKLVIYELPTAWTRGREGQERATGSFRDVLALVDRATVGANFDDLEVTRAGRSYLTELGINALELLPIADSFDQREWGYDPSHYGAPDHDLGFPLGNSSPTANSDLARLVGACHNAQIRFFVDLVMAFAKFEAYQYIGFDDFFIQDPKTHRPPPNTPEDPDAETSTRGFGRKELRDGFGSTLWRYARQVRSIYDPVSGKIEDLFPARQHLLVQLARWMRDFHVDGWRLDSIENVANWDFVGAFSRRAREHFHQRWISAGLPPGDEAEARFLVVGEELSLPFDILRQKRLDGLWNEQFQSRIRAMLLGTNSEDEPSFEWTVRRAIDCRTANGFDDGARAIIYVTKHDVEGFRHERLFNMLDSAGVDRDGIEKRVKLAFACLLTAVGIPMILAGEEFADQHDRFDANGNVTQAGGKQVDPVNFSRQSEPWRRRIFEMVARLVRFRTESSALGNNDTQFIHVDFEEGKRVVVWRRGGPLQDPVVVVANFSGWGSDVNRPNAEYRVPNWPATAPGRAWREISQGLPVPADWVGREPIYPWEAKVYALG